LASSLAESENRVAQREALLRAVDAPQTGLTLTGRLDSLTDQRSKMLGQRCELISEMMADTNNHAVSLFVCQFHLANLTDDVVRIMEGVSEPITYGNGNKPETLGGNLFSESV
jgi:hypothetical protein